jgi:hypothetical protein
LEASTNSGAQKKFSKHVIETALMLRLVFTLPLRQAEEFLRSVLALMSVNLASSRPHPLSRRSQGLDVGLDLVPIKGSIHLLVGSTGLLGSIRGKLRRPS